MAKDFINSGILGAGANVSDQAGFRRVGSEYISDSEFDPRLSDALPTVWSEAIAFRTRLEQGNGIAVEEWATIFLLHYFGVLHLNSFVEASLRAEFGAELWPTFDMTFPSTPGEEILRTVALLKTDDGTVVGAYFPQTIFFPAIDREALLASDSLKPFLDGTRFSWDRCKVFTDDDSNRDLIHAHLRSIARLFTKKELREAMESFCNDKLGVFEEEVKEVSWNPIYWETIGRRTLNPAELLNSYPLHKRNAQGGRTFYLLNGLDLNVQPQWAKVAVATGIPAPFQFEKVSETEISVKFSGNSIVCELEPNDRIVLLENLFLDSPPFWTKINKGVENFVNQVNPKHEVGLVDQTVRVGDRAICLAPIKADFLSNFPEVLEDFQGIRSEARPDGAVKWTFTVLGREICHSTKPSLNANIAKSNIAVYPPKVSRDWKLYVGQGTGSKEICGRWHLIDENGMRGKLVELEDEEYVSILHPLIERVNFIPKTAPNRPRAVCLTDSSGRERGIFFLAEMDSHDISVDQRAALAVDFGTSNTCFAVNTGESDVLNFSLSPKHIWGQEPTLENPGFIPRSWASEKGFFPTILMSRKSDDILPSTAPESVGIESLFKADIPCLHFGMGEAVVSERFDSTWRIHDNMKWDSGARAPWRSLFLQLSLMYAHAEVFFNKHAVIQRYVFTYPLAFSEEYGVSYHEEAKQTIRKVRQYCFGDDTPDMDDRYSKVDESSAVATAIGQTGLKGSMQAFLDIGGGTADLAIRHEEDFLVLDSLRIAGKNFFRFLKKAIDNDDFAGSKELLENLKSITGEERASLLHTKTLPLGTLYSILVNGYDEKKFKAIEEGILKAGMGEKSYARYRSRLFFNQLLAYAVIQTAAAAIDNKIKLTNGISIILGGNGWGLTLFAEWKRSSANLKREADRIIDVIKKNCRDTLSPAEQELLDAIYVSSVELLNETQLGKAKSCVAIGALRALESEHDLSNTDPYSGIGVKGITINNSGSKEVRWCDRWSLDGFSNVFGAFQQIDDVAFDLPDYLSKPIDENLAVFTSIGNTSAIGRDNMPGETWQKINGGLNKALLSMKVVGDQIVVPNPLDEGDQPKAAMLNYFLSELLYSADVQNDMLDDLAKANDSLFK